LRIFIFSFKHFKNVAIHVRVWCSGYMYIFVAEPFSWIYTIPQNVRSRRLTEKDISRLAQNLGSDWQFVAYDLGLSKVDVDHCIMGNPTPIMQIYSALQKWRVRQPSLCTLDHFVKVVKDCQATSVDSGAMYEIAKNM
jgi:hypothetical protein